MLKKSQNMISSTPTLPLITTIPATKLLYDQLLNVINNIQSFYHHYYNGLFCRCNIKMLTNNRRHQCKSINKNKIKRKSNSNNSYSINKTSINRSYISVTNLCNCKNNYMAFKENFKISYHIGDYLRQFYFDFPNNLKNIRLLTVIFVLSLITSTAQSINTQGKPQRKLISSIQPHVIKSTFLPLSLSETELDHIPGTETKQITNSDSIRCHIPYTINSRLDRHFRSHIYTKLRHIRNRSRLRHHQRYNSNKRHLKLLAKKRLTDQIYASQDKPNTTDQIVKHISINYQSHKPQLRPHLCHYHNQNDKQNILNIIGDITKTNYYSNTNVIRLENVLKSINNTGSDNAGQSAKEDEIKQLNINNFLNNIRLNYNYKKKYIKNDNNKNNNYIINVNSKNDTLLKNVNVETDENGKAKKEEDVNDTTTNNHFNDDDHDEFQYLDENENDNRGDVGDDDKGTNLFELLQSPTASIATVNSTIVRSITNINLQFPLQEKGQQIPDQYDDHAKLMKLVLNGLGLKKKPNMKNVSTYLIFFIVNTNYISVKLEYLTKKKINHN